MGNITPRALTIREMARSRRSSFLVVAVAQAVLLAAFILPAPVTRVAHACSNAVFLSVDKGVIQVAEAQAALDEGDILRARDLTEALEQERDLLAFRNRADGGRECNARTHAMNLLKGKIMEGEAPHRVVFDLVGVLASVGKTAHHGVDHCARRNPFLPGK